MSGSNLDYKFGNKNQWRRRLWNQIRARCAVPTRDAIVLYLAGKDDLDRKEAIRRGFLPKNMIAVDRDPRAIRSLRANGAIGINANFCDVMAGWNRTRDVHVVLADFCCGFDVSVVLPLAVAIMMPSFGNCVIAANFLRGRDSSSNWYREQQAPMMQELSRCAGYDPKHRGLFFWTLYSGLLISGGEEPSTTREYEERVANRYQWCAPRLNPLLLTYRSTANQTFDSIIWSPLSRAIPHVLTPEFRGQVINSIAGRNLTEGAPSAARKIAAALAHRTMYADRMAAP